MHVPRRCAHPQTNSSCAKLYLSTAASSCKQHDCVIRNLLCPQLFSELLVNVKENIPFHSGINIDVFLANRTENSQKKKNPLEMTHILAPCGEGVSPRK